MTDPADWPVSGPIARFGLPGLMLVFRVTNLLGLLNPRQVLLVVRQIRGNARLMRRERETGDDGAGYVTKGTYHLPFRGEWLVKGGPTPETSHSWDVLGQRFAYDFVQADEGFRRHTGRGDRVTDYRCYGADILAAADGEVVAAVDGDRDALCVGWGVCDFTARHFAGNHLVIRHADGEYAVYAHLIRGSLAAAPGAQVTRGQAIGRCGHSGHSTEPHLHFHLQDGPDICAAMGLPLRFADAEVAGARAPVDRALVTGDRARG